MIASKQDTAVPAGASARDPGRYVRPLWRGIAVLLVLAVFAQAVFAGLMLSGIEWGRAAHSLNSIVLIASTLAAGIAALVTIRHVPHGANLGFMLLALGVLVSLQTAIGKSSVEGANLMWVHIPLGVALVGFAAQTVTSARRLGGA
jgi:hypothetical protein